MNQTENPTPPPTGEAPAPAAGPRVTGEQMRDLRTLHRSVTDRKLAGVAGGLGRQLDVDPTVLRVLFVVFTFFGGAGLVLYVALWLLVPEDGRDRAVISAGNDLQRALLIGAGVAAVILVVGPGGGWFGQSLPVVLIVLACVVALTIRERRQHPPGSVGSTAPATPYTAAGDTDWAAGPGAAVPPPPARPAWAPPPYTPPSRPRRTGMVLFWPTLALLAISLGSLGLWDRGSGHVVDQAAYPALALALIGVMLVVGAFAGRPGGLMLLGVVAALTLATSNVTGGFHEGRNVRYTPQDAATVRPTYDMQTGELVLDLTQVSDPAALDGRRIHVDGDAGRIEVVVPSRMNVDVNADIRYAGGFDIGGNNNGGGFNPSVTDTLAGRPGDPTLDLELDLRVGEIDVRQQ